MIGMSNGVKKPHKEMQVTTTSQNHKKQTQYHQRERKNYHKLKKKRPQTTRVSKLLDSKQKQHYLPMNLKPPQTQSHHTLRSTRNWLKIAGKRAKLPDSKQQNYETSKQKTHKQKDMRVKTTVKRCRTTIARLKSMRKTLKTTTKRCKTTRGSKQSKLQKMLNLYRTLKHAHTIQDHSLYGLVALCVCVCETRQKHLRLNTPNHPSHFICQKHFFKLSSAFRCSFTLFSSCFFRLRPLETGSGSVGALSSCSFSGLMLSCCSNPRATHRSYPKSPGSDTAAWWETKG